MQCVTSIDERVDPLLFKLSKYKRECLKDEVCLNKTYPDVPWLKECSIKTSAINPSCIPSKFTQQIFKSIKLKSPAEQNMFIQQLFSSIKNYKGPDKKARVYKHPTNYDKNNITGFGFKVGDNVAYFPNNITKTTTPLNQSHIFYTIISVNYNRTYYHIKHIIYSHSI